MLLLAWLALLLALPAPLLAFPSAAPGNGLRWEGGASPGRALRGGTLFGGTLFGYKLKAAGLLVSSSLTAMYAGSGIGVYWPSGTMGLFSVGQLSLAPCVWGSHSLRLCLCQDLFPGSPIFTGLVAGPCRLSPAGLEHETMVTLEIRKFRQLRLSPEPVSNAPFWGLMGWRSQQDCEFPVSQTNTAA